MKLPKLFKKQPEPYRYIFEEQPFAFTPGFVYILQINSNQLGLKEVQELKDFFAATGVNVKLVAVRTNAEWALNPITAKHKYSNE